MGKNNKNKDKKPHIEAAPQASNPSAAPKQQTVAPQAHNPSVAQYQQSVAPQAHNLSVAEQQSGAPQMQHSKSVQGTSTLDLADLKAAMPAVAQPWQDEACWNLVTARKSKAKKQAKTPARKVKEARKAQRPTDDGSGAVRTCSAPTSVATVPGITGPAAPEGAPSEVAATAAPRAAKTKRTRRTIKRVTRDCQGERPKQFQVEKRNKPDDPITPQSGVKRRRQVDTTGSIKYSDALRLNDHCVAIMMEPYHDMSKEQAEAIEEQLQEVMDNEIFSPSTSAEPVVAPHFKGRAFHSEGTLKMWCGDDYALQWLKRSIGKVASPRKGTRLVVKKQSEIPRRVKVGLLVPQVGPNDTLDRIRMRITCQNTRYRVSNWALYSAVAMEEKSSLYLLLGIPEDDAQKLRENERRVHYKFGNLYAQFHESRSTAQPNLEVSEKVSTDPGSAVNKLGESQPGSSKEPVAESVEAGPVEVGPQIDLGDFSESELVDMDEAELSSGDGDASSP